VTKLSLKLDEKHLRDKIAAKVGARARAIVTSLHQEILDRTPYNTGRTIGSWVASADAPVLYDIASSGGDFAWDMDRKRTNPLAVGTEGEDRGVYERISLATVQKIDFEKNPFRIFHISNGASLDSGNDFMPMSSDLNQGPGSRAYYQEFGVIASYDVFNDKDSFFTPRGTNAVQLAVEKIRLSYGKL
jgi:hypothetical protein